MEHSVTIFTLSFEAWINTPFGFLEKKVRRSFPTEEARKDYVDNIPAQLEADGLNLVRTGGFRLGTHSLASESFAEVVCDAVNGYGLSTKSINDTPAEGVTTHKLTAEFALDANKAGFVMNEPVTLDTGGAPLTLSVFRSLLAEAKKFNSEPFDEFLMSKNNLDILKGIAIEADPFHAVCPIAITYVFNVKVTESKYIPDDLVWLLQNDEIVGKIKLGKE